MGAKRQHNEGGAKGEPKVDPRMLVLARALRKARKDAHLTQCELAGRMETSQMEIYRMESGLIDFGVSKLMDFAQALEGDGASIEIRISREYGEKGGFNTQTQFVVLREDDGDEQRSVTRALVSQVESGGRVEDGIVWLPDEDDCESISGWWR